MMKLRQKLFAAIASGLALQILTAGAWAAEIERVNHASAFTAESVHVPDGYSYYFLSGQSGAADPSAPAGSPRRYGDAAAQTRQALDNLKAILAKHGMTFADVVESHVFVAPDPSRNGFVDFDGVNKVWATEFGTAAQPNKPARSAIAVLALRGGAGQQVEIEMTAAKKEK
jgi:enamine deaminase RidA (YjgF/YER057c/UK114 family)